MRKISEIELRWTYTINLGMYELYNDNITPLVKCVHICVMDIDFSCKVIY